ncbi:aminoglycoside phosphotransferase family protein [Bacillus sp. FJAT-28004]|uniref:aminoglycoside phosphotransferase family protein n=1 Tax=Bacillus sp. FJAT-28004 TaxID=1679165 RepID=UPI0006B42F76|nr:aminoglycoside phosphotransferase family protein [Bacillus sp. FJAT-28004]
MNEQELIDNIVNGIETLQGSSRISKINKGYSNDQKFRIEKNGQLYLLKCFALDELAAKQAEYEVILNMQKYDVNCSKPLEMSTLPNTDRGYMLLTYIDGHEATEAISAYSEEVQYKIGLEAGQELAKMHRWHAPASVTPWYDRKLEKHKRYIEQYMSSGARMKDDAQFLSFIDRNLHLMKDRPNVFQHDDFHVGNLIIKDGSLAGVIDFDRWDWGDPVHEFLKAGMFSSEISIPFTIGNFKGYHGKQEPDDKFWTLYSLYLAMTIISSIVWILKVRPVELPIMMEKLERVLEDHNHFNSIVPRWYLEGSRV